MTIFGVDVSSAQGRPNWHDVAASGVVFAFAKATEGTTYRDPSYAYNRAAIPAAGLIPGAYHFLRATSSVVSQADAFAAAADPAAIHALDVEAAEHLDVMGWVARYRQHYPHKPLLIYTGRDLWHQCVGSLAGAQFGPLWCAGIWPNAYVTGTGSLGQLWSHAGSARGGLPWAGWTSAAIVQFTDQARVPGITGGVDGDAWLGSLADLKALTATSPRKDDPMASLDPAERAQLIADIAEAVSGLHAVHPVLVDPGTGQGKLRDGRDIDALPSVVGEIQHEQRRQADILDQILRLVGGSSSNPATVSPDQD